MMRSRLRFASFAAITALSLAAIARPVFAQSHGDEHGQAIQAAPASGEAHASGHETAHGSGHGGHHGPAPINWTDLSDKSRPAFIGLLINFGLLVTLYYTLGRKPVASALKQRREDIGKDIDEARRMLEEAKERAKKYQADLKNADTDAETAKAALVAAGKGEAERLLEEASERAERMKRDAERLVTQEKKQLEAELMKETVDLAVVQAQGMLEKTVTPEDHARLANELLAELARRPAAPKAFAGGVS
jgi:F-type H+-transporting ATPase subunit b